MCTNTITFHPGVKTSNGRSYQTQTSEPGNRSTQSHKKLNRSKTTVSLDAKSATVLSNVKEISNSVIDLPYYNPLLALNQVESMHNFVHQTSGEPPSAELGEIIKDSTAVSFKQNAKMAMQDRKIRDTQVIGCLIVEMFV